MSKRSSRVRSPDLRWQAGMSGLGRRILHAEVGGRYTSIEERSPGYFRVVMMAGGRSSYRGGCAQDLESAKALAQRLLAEK